MGMHARRSAGAKEAAIGARGGQRVCTAVVFLLVALFSHRTGMAAFAVPGTSGWPDLIDYDSTVVNAVFVEANGPCHSVKPQGISLAGAGLLGMLTGGVLGAAMGGTGRATALGAMAGGSLGLAAGAVGVSKVRANQIVRHDEIVCKFILDEAVQLQSLENGLVGSQPTGCGVESADINANPGGALSLMLQCGGVDHVSSSLESAAQQIASLNEAACRQIQRSFAISGTPRAPQGVLVIFNSYKDVASCASRQGSEATVSPAASDPPSTMPFEQTLTTARSPSSSSRVAEASALRRCCFVSA
jgi:hypothetical protein